MSTLAGLRVKGLIFIEETNSWPCTKLILTPYSGNEQKKRNYRAVQIVCKTLKAMLNINFPYLYKSRVFGRKMFSVGVRPDYKMGDSTKRMF